MFISTKPDLVMEMWKNNQDSFGEFYVVSVEFEWSMFTSMPSTPKTHSFQFSTFHKQKL